MKITIFAVEKPDGTFEALYVGPNSDQALDMFTALRANKGQDEKTGEAYVAAAVFQRPVTRKRAKFPENAAGAKEPQTPAVKPPAAKAKEKPQAAGDSGTGDEGEDTGI